MKLNQDFELKNIAGGYIVFPVGKKIVDFNGMLNLNETGAFLWEKLKNGADRQELIDAVCSEYAIDSETAGEDIDAFLQKLSDIGCLDLD